MEISKIMSFIPSGYGNATRVAPSFAEIPVPYVNGTYGKIIAHRINTISQLKSVPKKFGIELDIRYHEDELVLHHDPFSHHKMQAPEKFTDFLAAYKCEGPMILNVKTEGVEEKCIELMKQFKIKNWFFLDLSMPFFVKYAKAAASASIEGFGPENLAVRFSEEEPIEYALSFAKKVSWVWVDCFTKMPLDDENYKKLKEAGFKICLVSPELQKHSLDKIAEFKKQLIGKKIDAVCTKRADLWGY